MTDRDQLYLQHIIDAIERIERFTGDGRAAFMTDDKTQSAVIRQLESSAKLPSGFQRA